MDEITILASAASALLAGTAGVVWGRGTVWAETPSRQLETRDSAHVHEATTMNAGGWHCDCGKHMHSPNQEGRCLCGADDVKKEWA